MTHQWHDTYRHQITPAHHLDPRSKLFVGLLFIGIVLLTPHFTWVQAVGYPLLIVLSVVLARVPLKPLFLRLLAVLPFVVLMLISVGISRLPMTRFWNVLGKALCSLAVMSLITLTTPFPDLLRAMEQTHVPRFFTMFLAFLYRYGAVLYQETVQLEHAWAARYFGRFWLRQWIHLGHILASLFIRSYERAERVFAAMQARGFSTGAAGVTLLHFGFWDGVFVAVGTLLLMGIRWGNVWLPYWK
jgi:cobalt/nickel transport system permease protein